MARHEEPRAATKSQEIGGGRIPGRQCAPRFGEALGLFVAHDEAHDWTPAACLHVAAMFDDVASMQGANALATFNAGLAHHRCGDDSRARAHFERSGAALAWDSQPS